MTWDLDAAVKEISYKVTDANAPTCSTVSEILQVVSLDPIQVLDAEKVLPTCPGESNASVSLKVSGGSGDYIYTWSHDPNLQSSIASNLKAGSYLVTISDKSGCGSLKHEIVIADPSAMRLTRELQILPTTCAGVNDGGFRAKISGGVPPYSVEGFNSTWNGEELEVKNLSSGNFSLFILDSKGCSLPVSGIIPENKPMVLSFTEVSPGCPGGASGALTVNISGGKPPYLINWTEGDGSPSILGAASSKSQLSTGPTLSAVPSGFYSVAVMDANGCIVSSYGRVRETAPKVRMPTGYMPKDGLFGPVSNCSVDFTLQVWDRWGQVIYLGNEGWDGTVRGNDAPVGSYTYQLTYSYTIEGIPEQVSNRGVFTLIR